MKKKFFTLFSATLATLALALLSSCSGITSPSEPEAATAHQAEGLSLRGTFSMANATAEPSLESTTQNSSHAQRNAVPAINGLNYYVTATRISDSHKEFATDLNVTAGYYEFRNNLSSGTWQILAYATQTDAEGSHILESTPQTITLSKTRPDASANLALKPSTEGTGSVVLTINWTDDSHIGYCKFSSNDPNLSGESSPSGATSVTQSTNSIQSGIYEVTFEFYTTKANYQNGAKPLYKCTEYIAVYPNLNTDTWTKSTAPHIASDGTFKVTAACVQTFIYKSIYLSSSGDDDTANGTSERPYKTVKKAMERLTELATNSVLTTSEDSPWELHVIGEIKANSNTDLASSSCFVNVSGLSIQHLAIIGEGSGAIINANEKATVLHVCGGANVSMENITLTKGSGVSGGGVAIDDTGTTFTIKSGSITGNKATSFGGGVYIGSGGTLNMSGGSITSNESSGKGGGIYAYGSFTGTSTTIKTNTASTCGNNIFINSTCPSTVPDGNNSFYNDTTSTNGKADAVCLIDTKQFARFNNPSSGTTDFNGLVKTGNGIFDTSKATTLYIGNSNDSTAKTWKASETIIPAGVVTIASASSVKQEIKASSTVSQNLVKATNDLTLNKIILNGDSSVRCVWCQNKTVTMTSSTLTGGGGQPTGAGLYITGVNSVETPKAIIDENSSVENCDNSSVESSKGGGIYVDKGSGTSATLTLSGKVSGCKSKNGGGIYLNNGTVTLSGNAVVGKYSSNSTGYASESTDGRNMATENGGGVYVQAGTFNMEGSSKVSFNIADNNEGTNRKGGGIYVAGGNVSIGTASASSPSVCNNHGTSRGGGIYIAGGTVKLYGSIKYNHSSNSCGGAELEVGSGKLETYSGSLISNNSSNLGGYHGNGVIVSSANATLYMYGGTISSNGNYDVSIENSGYLKMEGGANAGKVCTKIGTAWIYAKGGLTATPAATITPVNGNALNYDTSKVIVNPLGSDSMAAACAKFAVANDASGNAWTIGDDGKLHTIIQQSSGEINIGSLPTYVGGAYSTEIYITTTNNNITLKNLTKPSVANHSALTLNAASGNIDATIYLTGTNSLTASNHGGIKFTGPAGRQINLTFNTTSSGTLSFDSTSHKDIQIENVNYTISIASGLSFTGRVGTTTYTDATAFFNAAKNSTAGSTFTITKQ